MMAIRVCLMIITISCLAAYCSALPEVVVMSSGSTDVFWMDDYSRINELTMDKRALGTLNRWQYTNFDGTVHQRMNLLEEHFAHHVIAYIAGQRHGGANGSLSEDAMFFANTVIPALDGAKYVSEAYAASDDIVSVYNDEGQDLVTFGCDLDWKQPDPFADDSQSLIFSADDGYCSVDSELVLIKATGVQDAADAIDNVGNVDLLVNRFSNIAVACTHTQSPSTFYCAALFSDLEPVLDSSCVTCCSLSACA